VEWLVVGPYEPYLSTGELATSTDRW